MTISPLNAFVERLESVEALDGLGRPAGRVVRGLIPDGVPKGVLSGAWLGHALHPILTDIPIGVWTSSVLLDWTGGEDSESASDRLILTGVLAAGATVATGWSDWADAEQASAAVRRSGLFHAAANATATALMISSYIARKQGARGRGRLLSLAGSAALGAGGWLGGHLSYTLGAGVTAGAHSGGDAGVGGDWVGLSAGGLNAGGGHPNFWLREQQRRCHGRLGTTTGVRCAGRQIHDVLAPVCAGILASVAARPWRWFRGFPASGGGQNRRRRLLGPRRRG